MRSLTKDYSSEYLLKQEIPFVVIGSIDNSIINQVDVSHADAACDITSELLKRKSKRIGAIIGGMNYVVNTNRYKGYIQGHINMGIEVDYSFVKTNIITQEEMIEAVDSLLGKVDTIICGDDNICISSITRIHQKGLRIPEDIQVASLYDSSILSSRDKPITSVVVDDKKLGEEAFSLLVNVIENKENYQKICLGYSIEYKESTLK